MALFSSASVDTKKVVVVIWQHPRRLFSQLLLVHHWPLNIWMKGQCQDGRCAMFENVFHISNSYSYSPFESDPTLCTFCRTPPLPFNIIYWTLPVLMQVKKKKKKILYEVHSLRDLFSKVLPENIYIYFLIISNITLSAVLLCLFGFILCL